MRTDYKEIIAYAKKAKLAVYGNDRTDAAEITTVVGNILKKFKIKSSEYEELINHILDPTSRIQDAWQARSKFTILDYNQLDDWTGDAENILKITKLLKTSMKGIITLFDLNNVSFTKKQILTLLKEHKVTGKYKREHDVQSDWSMLQNIKPSYLADFSDQYIKTIDISYNATHYSSAYTISRIVDCLKFCKPLQIQEHIQYFKDNLNKTNAAKHVELRFIVSKKLWEDTIKNGITNEEDADLLATMHTLGVISDSDVNNILEITLQTKNIHIFDYIVDTHENCKLLSLDRKTLIEYWKDNIEKLDMTRLNTLRTIVESNRYTSENENKQFAYYDIQLCSAFIKLYQQSPNTVIDHMRSWQYRQVDENKNITNTTLTPYILLVLFRHLDSINITKRKEFNSYFPGFSTKEGRTKLINTYFPELKTIIGQPELFDTACLLQAHWNNTHTVKPDTIQLPSFEFD